MDKARAKKLLPIITAFSEGAKIESSANGVSWVEVNDPVWAKHQEYRIKPEPKLVPFTFEDNKLFRDKWIRAKGYIPLVRITSINQRGFDFYQNNNTITWQYALSNYEFEDGSPVGKYIEE